MRNKKSLFLLLSLCSLLILMLFPINIKGQADIPYTFNSDVLYSNDDSDSLDNRFYNMKNSSAYTEIYNASYTFTDDDNNDPPDDWVDSSGGDTSATVQERIDGHSKILELFDFSGANRYVLKLSIANTTTARVDFWFRSNDTAKGGEFRLTDAGNAVRIFLTFLVGVVDDVWFHYSIEWNTGPDTYTHWLNGIEIANGVAFDAISDGITGFTFIGSGVNSDYVNYVDGFGYDFDPFYETNDNFVPLIETDTSIKEVDRWYFAYSDLETLLPIGNDEFNGWTEFEEDGDKVNIIADPVDTFENRLIEILHDDGVFPRSKGIVRTFNVNGDIINITWATTFDDIGGLSEFTMELYSSDDTLIHEIFFETNQLKYNPGAVFLYVGITTGEYYELNLYVNYADEISVLDFYIDGVFEDTYYIPLMASGKEGIDNVRFRLDGGIGADMTALVDYVGVYVNDTSQSTEFGYSRLHSFLNSGTWDFQDFNLIRTSIIGRMSFWISRNTYIPPVSSVYQMFPLATYGVDEVFNVYDFLYEGASFRVAPDIWIQFYEQIEFINLSIEGAILTQGINEYRLEYEHGNIDVDESYFFVDSSNRLQFIHIANDTNLEYIQARFNINDEQSNDSAIYFRSRITDRALGFFRVNYTQVSNLFPLSTLERNSRIILSQGLTIRDYIILITDNDNDAVSGLTTGYVSNVELIFISNIAVTIIVSSLIDIIIPLIMIIVPTLGLSARVGKVGIVPIFDLMSLLLLVTEIIPVWLFFVIAVSSALFIFIKRREVLF